VLVHAAAVWVTATAVCVDETECGLAVSHYIEHQTGWSIKKFVRTTRRYRTVIIKARRQTLTAADPLPDALRDALAKISCAGVQ
jgi:hypothetical protein